MLTKDGVTYPSKLLTTLFLAFAGMFISVAVVNASTDECNNTLYGYENRVTKCIDYFDNSGAIIEDHKYLKCNDTITCDKDPVSGKVLQRCCIEPHTGSFGGHCTNPADIDRTTLGSMTLPIFNTQTRPCDYDEDAKSPQGLMVITVPQKTILNPDWIPGQPDPPMRIPAGEQSLVELYDSHAGDQGFVPDVSQTSEEGHDIYKESISVVIKPILGLPPRSLGTEWYYELNEDTKVRRYFVRRRNVITNPYTDALVYHLSGIPIEFMPVNPYPPLGSQDIGKVLSCKIANAIKKPIGSALSSVTKAITTSENIPDINLLCSEGFPQFENTSLLNFDENGKIIGFDPAKCYCTDTNAGPANAAVLLCTRFIAGIDDATAPWRLLVPVPDSSGEGSQRFLDLLTGAPEITGSIDEFQNKVKSDIRGFFDSANEVKVWISQILNQVAGNPAVYPRDLFNTRFFGTDNPPQDPNQINVSVFKDNPYVRQYIGCLSCAKYGGFPTALGCMPADRVDRFLAEGVLGIGIGLAGAISVLCIIYGAIQFQLSEGEAAKVQKAQKLITQCILGLLLILFSVFLLRFVGVNLLRIYGLG